MVTVLSLLYIIRCSSSNHYTIDNIWTGSAELAEVQHVAELQQTPDVENVDEATVNVELKYGDYALFTWTI